MADITFGCYLIVCVTLHADMASEEESRILPAQVRKAEEEEEASTPE